MDEMEFLHYAEPDELGNRYFMIQIKSFSTHQIQLKFEIFGFENEFPVHDIMLKHGIMERKWITQKFIKY